MIHITPSSVPFPTPPHTLFSLSSEEQRLPSSHSRLPVLLQADWHQRGRRGLGVDYGYLWRWEKGWAGVERAKWDIYLIVYYCSQQLLESPGQLMEPLLSNLLNGGERAKNGLHELPQHPQTHIPNECHSSQHRPSRPKNTPYPLSDPQKYALNAQVLAYKHLVRNLPVPLHVSEPIAGISGVEARRRAASQAVNSLVGKREKEEELRGIIFPPSKTPARDDFNQSEQMKYSIEKRRNELEHTLAKADQLTHTSEQRLLLENRFLGCRQLYRGLLGRVAEGMRRNSATLGMFEGQLLDRNYFKRERLGRGELTGRSERNHHLKTDNDRRKRLMHRECMQHLKLHKEEFTEWHKKKLKDRRKIANQVKNFIESRRREQQQAQERRRLARLKQLKAYNIVEYLNLVEEEKKSKIRQLLSQTNKFLKELGARVLVQKGGNKQEEGKNIEEVEEENLQSIFQSSNSVYYNLTHTIQEQITSQPTFLTGGTLKKYQLHGLQWLVSLYNNNLNGILADEMGLGKTIQTIALLCHLIEYKKNFGPFLIVAPLSTIPNWMAEFQKWAPTIRKIVYKGNPNTRAETRRIMKTTKWNVCITTYDFILKDRLKLNKEEWKYIVIDEGHKMKNAKSKFSTILGQQYQSDHRLLLTGTPLQNNLTELWALLNFLLPKVFNSCDDFEKWFSMALYKSTGDQKVQLDEQEQLLIINRLHQVLRPFLLRRVKKEVYSQLPDKKEHVIKVELSPWQKLIYDNISSKTALEFANSSSKISRTTLNNLMMQLRKCCNHPFLFLKNYDQLAYNELIVSASGKIELIDRILPKLLKFKHRVLIFTQMTQLMDIMQCYFRFRGISHLRLDGSTKAEDRQERMKVFNQPESPVDVFLLSTRAGGLGLNLQTADTVIIFDSDWNPQMDLQAQDRVHRIGQEKEVIVLRLITNNSIQEHILERTAFKMNLNELFIQGGLYNLNSSEAQRRKKIEDILLKTRKQEEDNESEQVIDDDMINQFLKRNEEEYEQFGRMDEERYAQDGQQNENKRNYNYRLMRESDIPSWFKETPRAMDEAKEYGRGNRIRRQINYSDEVIDDKVLNISEMDEEGDFSEHSISRSRPRPPQAAQLREVVDIDQLLNEEKPPREQAFFEEDE